MVFAIKAEVRDPRKTLEFTAQKTMYGGKNIAEGDTVFIFASENEGGSYSAASSQPLSRSRRRLMSFAKPPASASR